MNYKINETIIHYEADGSRAFGEDIVLLDQGIDLTVNTNWTREGFGIENLFDSKLYRAFFENTATLLIDCWKRAGLHVPQNFTLDQYHTIAPTWDSHLLALEKTKLLSVTAFPVSIHLLEERISEICKQNLEVKNPYDNQSVFHFRVIRPRSHDNNPLHRDIWLEDYKDCINLYIPIAGSSMLSSLIIIPKSHRWPESKIEKTTSGAVISGIKFNVPAVTSIAGDFQVVRPDPKQNEVLIFSPYLIHGGSANLETDRTRISIEVRLWKK